LSKPQNGEADPRKVEYVGNNTDRDVRVCARNKERRTASEQRSAGDY
jgi:hypothetical protein